MQRNKILSGTTGGKTRHCCVQQLLKYLKNYYIIILTSASIHSAANIPRDSGKMHKPGNVTDAFLVFQILTQYFSFLCFIYKWQGD
jgi:hypothetical protein